MLQSMGLQRVGHTLVIEEQQQRPEGVGDYSRSQCCYTGSLTAAQALGLLISWTNAVSAVYLGLGSPGVAHGEEQALMQPWQDGHLPVSDPAAFSNNRHFGDLKSRGGNIWAGTASLTSGASGKPGHPPCPTGLGPVQSLHAKPQSHLSSNSSTRALSAIISHPSHLHRDHGT